MKVFLIIVFIIFMAVLAAAAVPIELPISTNSGISLGAAIGLIATWIMVSFAYINLRRTIRRDQDEEIDARVRAALAIYTEKVREEWSRRGATFMDRGVQEQINKQNDERYLALVSNEKLCDEIRQLTTALYANKRSQS